MSKNLSTLGATIMAALTTLPEIEAWCGVEFLGGVSIVSTTVYGNQRVIVLRPESRPTIGDITVVVERNFSTSEWEIFRIEFTLEEVSWVIDGRDGVTQNSLQFMLERQVLLNTAVAAIWQINEQHAPFLAHQGLKVVRRGQQNELCVFVYLLSRDNEGKIVGPRLTDPHYLLHVQVTKSGYKVANARFFEAV